MHGKNAATASRGPQPVRNVTRVSFAAPLLLDPAAAFAAVRHCSFDGCVAALSCMTLASSPSAAAICLSCTSPTLAVDPPAIPSSMRHSQQAAAALPQGWEHRFRCKNTRQPDTPGPGTAALHQAALALIRQGVVLVQNVNGLSFCPHANPLIQCRRPRCASLQFRGLRH